VSKKIDFIIVGVMKCGTTTLGGYLELHKQIAIPEWEVGFFNKPQNFNKGYGHYEDYVDKYATSETIIRGEKTPYSFDKSITPKLYAYNPNLKLVFILRNPVDRAWSNYGHDLWNLYEKKSFEKCIQQEDSRNVLYQYLSKGRYIEQLMDYLNYFPKEQIHIIIFEEFLKQKKPTLEKLFDFLGVASDEYDFDQKVHNKKSYHPKYRPWLLHMVKNTIGMQNRIWNWAWRLHFGKPQKKKMSEPMKKKLTAYYAPYNAELELFLGREIKEWKS
jgi:hypothetical protein